MDLWPLLFDEQLDHLNPALHDLCNASPDWRRYPSFTYVQKPEKPNLKEQRRHRQMRHHHGLHCIDQSHVLIVGRLS